MNLFEMIIRVIYSPVKAFNKISISKKSKRYGWIFTLLFAFLYTITVIMFHLNGFIPVLKLFLPFPVRKYYYYQAFLTFPVSIIGVLINYGIIKRLLRLFSNEIDTEGLWGSVAIASLLPSYFILWFFETFVIVLYFSNRPWTYFIIDIVRIISGILWTIFLTICSIYSLDDIQWKTAIPIGLISSIVMMTFWGIFFR